MLPLWLVVAPSSVLCLREPNLLGEKPKSWQRKTIFQNVPLHAFWEKRPSLSLPQHTGSRQYDCTMLVDILHSVFLLLIFVQKNHKIILDNHVDSRRHLIFILYSDSKESKQLGRELVLESFHIQPLVLLSDQNPTWLVFNRKALGTLGISCVHVDKGQNDRSTESLIHTSH